MSKCAGASSLLLEAIMKITHVEKYNTLKNPYNDLNIFFPIQMWPLVLLEKCWKIAFFHEDFMNFRFENSLSYPATMLLMHYSESIFMKEP